jgi:hypothetical protein
VIGKRPGPATAEKIDRWIARLAKPCVTHFTGDAALGRDDGAGAPATLEDAALAAVALARGTRHAPREFTRPDVEIETLVAGAVAPLAPGRRFVRGIYAGGTLAQEAAALLGALGPVGWGAGGAGHRVVDLGDDRYTVGRPHPMIDGTVRREWIAREAADPATAVILLDLVLGYGAHADPAGELHLALEDARRRQVPVVASVCGTEADPQGLTGQAEALRRAGALVMPSNAQAARLAVRIARRAPTGLP